MEQKGFSEVQAPKDKCRARIGLIIPSTNRTVEKELLPMYPSDIGVHIARVRLKGVEPEDLRINVAAAARTLADAACSVIVFNCTASSMEHGNDENIRLLDAIHQGSGAIPVTTASAIMDAMNALDARSLALLTPYSKVVTQRQRAFFEEARIKVHQSIYTEANRSPDYCFIPSATWLDELTRSPVPATDVYLLSCANLACFEIINEAEERLGLPVLTSNQCVLWSSLRNAGIDDVLSNIGRLGTLPLASQQST
jgi:maleate isomerase